MTVMTPDVVSPDRRTTLKALQLGPMLDTQPEQLTMAGSRQCRTPTFSSSSWPTRSPAGIEVRLAASPSRRAPRRHPARHPGSDRRHPLLPALRNEPASRQFLDGPHALILGPAGAGKTHLAWALGHVATRRCRTVHMATAGKLFKRLEAARLDNTLEAEMRRLAGVELLILDPIRRSSAPVRNVCQRGLNCCFRTSACRYPRSDSNVGDVGMIGGHGGAA